MRKADLIKFINCESSLDEQGKVFKWLEASEQNRMYFEHLRAMWVLPAIPEGRAEEEDYERFRRRFDLSPKRSSRKYAFWTAAVVAASALIFLLITPFLKMSPEVDRDIIAVSNPGNEISFYCLPDGSRIALFPQSSISYHQNFLEKREIVLKGTGFFEIFSNPDKPLHVYTDEVDICVTGTKFLVDGDQLGREKVDVFLEEGTISVNLLDRQETVSMVPGERLIMDKAGIVKKMSEGQVPAHLSQVGRSLCFENLEMSKVLKKLEGYYNVTFVCKDKDIPRLLFTGDLNNETLDICLAIFYQTMNVSSKVDGRTVTLY